MGRRASFVLYLLALALFPFNYLTPFSYEQAGWSDLFILAATAAWIIEKAPRLRSVRLRPPHFAYAAYLGAGALSSVVVAKLGLVSVRNFTITCELVALAVLTSDFASVPSGRRAIVRTVLLVTAIAAVQGAIGLVVFYAGGSTAFTTGGSGYLAASDAFTRVDAGFFGAALLGSFCIFASAVIALPEGGLSSRTQRLAQIALAALVLLTLSRAVLGFALAFAIRRADELGTARAQRTALVCGALVFAASVALTVVPLSADPLRPQGAGAENPRLATLKTSAESFADKPLLGHGPGSLTGKLDGEPSRAHFTPVNIAATIGVFGLVAICALVFLLWRQRRRPTNAAIWGGMAGLGIDAMGQDAEHFRHVWMMFGLADADREDGRREAEPPVQDPPTGRR